MSQSQRPKGAPGGSVRRARELMEAGLPPETSYLTQSPPRQRAGDAERGPGTASPARPRPPMPAALSAPRGVGQSIGMAISRPTQVPQWPLAAPVQGRLGQGNTTQPQSSRGPAPQRPPRPSKSKVPSMLDASKLQDHTPSFQYTPQLSSSPLLGSQLAVAGDGLSSPNVKSPLTPASRTSTLSSAGSIPDFPMPVPGPSDPSGSSGPARKSANLGPPPTARRGASSYYSNISFVSPIQEESPRTQQTHESYASSAAMPTSWRDDASDFLDDDDSGERNIFAAEPIPEEGRDSRASNGDDSSERGLVRSASIGRRGKPSVVTTKSFERTPPASSSPPLESDKLAKMGVFGPMEMRAAQMKAAAVAHANAAGARPSPTPVQAEQRETRWPMMGTTDSPLAGGTGLIESSSSETSSTLGRTVTPKGGDTKAFSPPPFDPRMSKILHAHQAASGVQTADEKELERSFSRLSAIRRPPKLDLNAVRDAEARGSLTSLPDLIKRATKLAAMIDKGKRPGSRLNNLNDFSDSDLARKKEEGAFEGRRPQSGLSGMLAAFPPPGLATPRDHSPRPQASWSTHIASTNPLNPKGPSGSKPGRRCCGLPIWLFLLITLVTLLIVAAAVLVPLFLLVINKSLSNTSNTASQLAQCQQSTPCANGGSSIISSNTCSCICANGFTGSTCSVASSSGCTTTSITSSNGTLYNNVTLGESIPRLISGAKTNFSISLSSDIILARFSSANLSCDAENALVTFNGQDWPVGSASSPASESAIGSPTPTPTAKAMRQRRDTTFTSTSFSTTTSLNPTIIIDTSVPPITTSTPTSTPARTSPSTAGAGTIAASPSPSPSAAATAAFTLTQESLDFARVAVLYILQKQSMNNAVTAQSEIQSFFNTALTRGVLNSQAGNVTAGDGNSIDFWRWSLVLAGGERVGSSG